VARGSAHVEAWESAHVEAWDFATAIELSPSCQIKLGSRATKITPDYPADPVEWATLKNCKIDAAGLHLWKVVRLDGTDFRTGTINYLSEAISPDWKADYRDECGCALHLADSPSGARYFVPCGQDFRLFEVVARLLDCRCFPGRPEYPMKLRARACRFVREVEKDYSDE
jgi:hypothetical protein